MVQAAQALALLRGRNHVVAEDVADLAADVLRHRLVLTYDALGDGVTARRPARPHPRHRRRHRAAAAHGARTARSPHDARSARRPARAPGPGPDAGRAGRGARPRARPPRVRARCPASAGRPGAGTGTELAQIRPYQVGDDVRQHRRRRERPHRASRTSATTCPSARSRRGCCSTSRASMAFGTADRLKSDVAEGVALGDRPAGRAPRGPRRAAHLRRARARSSCRRAAAAPR